MKTIQLGSSLYEKNTFMNILLGKGSQGSCKEGTLELQLYEPAGEPTSVHKTYLPKRGKLLMSL